jgi:type IV pilus assembly protein PilB
MRPAVVDLSDASAVEAAPDVRKLVYLVLLVALKDEATEVRFEPREDECGISEVVAGKVYELVPAPLSPARVVNAIKALVGLDFVRRSPPREASARLRVGAFRVEVCVRLEPTERGERAVLLLPGPGVAAAAAYEILQTYLESRQPIDPDLPEGERR